MRLMISVVSASEARAALQGGAEILDVKNPAEGSLGAQFPRVIRAVKDVSYGRVPVSAAIGDMPDLPGTAALAALGAASCGADYIKIGLYGPRNETEAATLLREAKMAVQEYDALVIAAGYADYQRSGTLNPEFLPEVAASAGIDGCLLDTTIKDGRTIFDFIDSGKLRGLAEEAHQRSLLFGLAGSLGEKDLASALEIRADIIGLRTAVCRNHQRNGPLDGSLVRRFVTSLQELEGTMRVPIV
jgi:uncharacterized protein (UPF0264 family)